MYRFVFKLVLLSTICPFMYKGLTYGVTGFSEFALCVSSFSHILRNLGIFVVTLAAYTFWLYLQLKDFNGDTCRQRCDFSQKRVKTSLVDHESSSWIVCQLTDVTPYWCECPCGKHSRKKDQTNDETTPDNIVNKKR